MSCWRLRWKVEPMWVYFLQKALRYCSLEIVKSGDISRWGMENFKSMQVSRMLKQYDMIQGMYEAMNECDSKPRYLQIFLPCFRPSEKRPAFAYLSPFQEIPKANCKNLTFSVQLWFSRRFPNRKESVLSRNIMQS